MFIMVNIMVSALEQFEEVGRPDVLEHNSRIRARRVGGGSLSMTHCEMMMLNIITCFVTVQRLIAIW